MMEVMTAWFHQPAGFTALRGIEKVSPIVPVKLQVALRKEETPKVSHFHENEKFFGPSYISFLV